MLPRSTTGAVPVADDGSARLVHKLQQKAEDGQAEAEVDVEDAAVGRVLAERTPVDHVCHLSHKVTITYVICRTHTPDRGSGD